VISHNPIAGSARVDPAIVAALGAEEYRLRLGAVAELALNIDEDHTAAARAAHMVLQRHLEHERDFAVRSAVLKALGQGGPAETPQATRQRIDASRSAETSTQQTVTAADELPKRRLAPEPPPAREAKRDVPPEPKIGLGAIVKRRLTLAMADGVAVALAVSFLAALLTQPMPVTKAPVATPSAAPSSTPDAGLNPVANQFMNKIQ
jgi:hypothetical protein